MLTVYNAIRKFLGMSWKLKSKLQHAVSMLPSSASYTLYYWLQKNFGWMKNFNPVRKLIPGIEMWKRIQQQGYIPAGKVFFEVGTGRVPLMPLAFWLMGAKKIITVDLHPYVKAELVARSLQYMYDNKEEIVLLFGSLIDRERFNNLLSLDRDSDYLLSEFFRLCQIDYIAPGNATDTSLPGQYVDFHTSYKVLEHIPLAELTGIFTEGNRIVKNNGLFIHKIDYSDHFSHLDRSISAINFLQYSDKKWEKYAGNIYMYMNRLRHDDYLNLFKSLGHQVIEIKSRKDRESRDLLISGGLHLDERFRSKSEDVLATTEAWIVSQKNN